MPEIKLSHGTVDYRDEGTGDPVVLIHGVLVNGRVWQDVVPLLSPWGTRDRFFPLTDAQRLASLCADAELVTIDGARAFVQLDAPARLAEIVLATAAGTGKGG